MKDIIIMLLDEKEIETLCTIKEESYFIEEFDIIKVQEGIAKCSWVHVKTKNAQTAYNLGRILAETMRKNLRE